jgi:hypothetical protein
MSASLIKARSIKPSGVVFGTWKARDQDIIDSHDTHALPTMRFHHPLESMVLPVLDL